MDTNTAQPFQTQSINDKKPCCPYKGPTICSILSATAAACGAIFMTNGPSSRQSALASCAGNRSETSFLAPQISPECPEISYQAYVKHNKETLDYLIETQDEDPPLFYTDTTTKEAPVTVDIKGELKNSPRIRAIMDANLKFREYEISNEDIDSDPELIKLRTKCETAFSKWHGGKEVQIQAMLLTKKSQMANIPFHVDKQKGEDTHFTISFIPLEEIPVTLTHTHWVMSDDDVTSIDKDSYSSNQTSIRAYSQNTKEYKEYKLNEFAKPLCVPNITSRIIPGALAKDIPLEESSPTDFFSYVKDYHDSIGDSYVYLAPAQAIRANIQVHSGPNSNDAQHVIDRDYKENPLSRSVCNAPRNKWDLPTRYRIEPRVLLATRYQVIS